MQSPTNSDSAPVDFERLREISDDDRDLMNELIDLYVQQTGEFLDVLSDGIARQDFESIRQIAHKALGGSATCGMNAVIPFFRELEKAGADKNLEAAERALAQSQTAFQQIQAFLEANQSRP